jgi:hypothetical protein
VQHRPIDKPLRVAILRIERLAAIYKTKVAQSIKQEVIDLQEKAKQASEKARTLYERLMKDEHTK